MSRLVLNSVFSYILVFAITLIVVGLAVGANCSRRVANDSGERAPGVLATTSRRRGLFGKIVSARRRNQHARRVRSPEVEIKVSRALPAARSRASTSAP